MDSEVSKVAKLIADHIGHGMREKCEPLAGEIIAALAQPSAAGDARDAARWLWARNKATQQDWQQMAARCTTGLALDRYADAAIDAALTGAQP